MYRLAEKDWKNDKMKCYFGPFVSDKIVLRNKYISTYISTYSMIIMQTDRSGLINIVYAVTPSVCAQNNLSYYLSEIHL